MKIGVFAQFLPDYTPEQGLEFLAGLGFDGVMLMARGEKSGKNRMELTVQEVLDQADDLRAKAEGLGLALPSLGGYFGFSFDESELVADLDRAEVFLKAAAAIGAKAVRLSTARTQRRDSPPFPRMFETAKVQYRALARLAERHGVRALVETHGGTLTASCLKARVLFEGIDPQWVGIAWDPGNQVREGGEPYRVAVDTAGPYLAELHAKNTRYADTGETDDGQRVWRFEIAPLSEGIVHWPQVMDTLRRAGFDGWVFLEQVSPRRGYSMEDELRAELTWLRELAAREPSGAL